MRVRQLLNKDVRKMHKISLNYQSKNQVKSSDLESVLDASGLLNEQMKLSSEKKKQRASVVAR